MLRIIRIVKALVCLVLYDFFFEVYPTLKCCLFGYRKMPPRNSTPFGLEPKSESLDGVLSAIRSLAEVVEKHVSTSGTVKPKMLRLKDVLLSNSGNWVLLHFWATLILQKRNPG